MLQRSEALNVRLRSGGLLDAVMKVPRQSQGPFSTSTEIECLDPWEQISHTFRGDLGTLALKTENRPLRDQAFY